MTSTQIARDAAYLVKSQPIAAVQQPAATCPVIARMNSIEAGGKYDRNEDGLRRIRQGAVGGVQCTVQVATSGDGLGLSSETLLIFRSLEDGHQRRLLHIGIGNILLDTGRGNAVRIGSNNKYWAACAAVLAARLN